MTLGVKQHIGRGRVSRRTENKGLINNQEFIWQNAGIKTVQYWSKYDNSWNHMLTILGKELVKSYIERRKKNIFEIHYLRKPSWFERSKFIYTSTLKLL